MMKNLFVALLAFGVMAAAVPAAPSVVADATNRCKHGNPRGQCRERDCREGEGEGSQPIPEPATVFLMGSGLAAGAAAYRRRKNANAIVEN